MEESPPGARGRLRPTQMGFLAMGLGAGLAVLAASIVAPLGRVGLPLIDGLFLASAAATVLAVLAAFLLQQRVAETLSALSAEAKAEAFVLRRSVITMAVMEVPAALSLVGFLLSADEAFLLFLVPYYVVLSLLFPTEERIRARLRAVGQLE